MSMYDLPDIQYVPIDPEATKNNTITVYEAISGRTLFPGDPIRLFLLSQTEIIIQQQIKLNDVAKSTLLRYARGAILDHMAAFVETPRLAAAAAVTTVRFSISAPRLEAILIPPGVRVTPGNNLFFATSAVAEIPIGSLYVDVRCVCLTAGTTGNGYLPGQINTLVDPQPYVSSVSNLTESSGGTNVEADDPYRERINTAPERFSVAGPAGAYEYWARTAHPGIMDVRVDSPAPTQVSVVVLMTGGELPTQDILDAVDAVVNDRTIRPLTDKVTVSAPTVVNYTVGLEYWIDTRNAADAVSIQAAVQRAVQDYVMWQKTKIGRSINPSELVRRVMNSGARRVTVSDPAYTVLDEDEIAIIDDPTTEIVLTYGGLEDD